MSTYAHRACGAQQTTWFYSLSSARVCLLTGLSLEEVLAALDAVGESLTAEDRVPPDAAELAALELGRVVVFSPSALGG